MSERTLEIRPTEESLERRVLDMRKRLTGVGNKKRFEAHSRIVEKARKLEAKHKNSNRVYLLHTMTASSGIERKICPDFDFQGEDSVVTIMENLCKEYEV